MFNKFSFKSLKITSLMFCLLCLFSCEDETMMSFSEINILVENESVVEINIPKAEGDSEASKKINETLVHFTNRTLNIDAAKDAKTTIKENIEVFNASYKTFKAQIEKLSLTDLPVWEALVDGEILYKNEAIISIAMSSSINTGGAHGNVVMHFFNFDQKTGALLKNKDLFHDVSAFTALAKKHYEKELFSSYTNTEVDFGNKGFRLPKTLGFSQDGVILFFDTLTPTSEPLEFTIPYAAANEYLKF